MKILSFRGSLNLTPFVQRFYRKSQIWGTTFGASSPPSGVRYVLTPPIPVSFRMDRVIFSTPDETLVGEAGVLVRSLLRGSAAGNWVSIL